MARKSKRVSRPHPRKTKSSNKRTKKPRSSKKQYTHKKTKRSLSSKKSYTHKKRKSLKKMMWGRGRRHRPQHSQPRWGSGWPRPRPQEEGTSWWRSDEYNCFVQKSGTKFYIMKLRKQGRLLPYSEAVKTYQRANTMIEAQKMC